MSDSLKKATGLLTTIRLVVLCLICLSAILVQAGSGVHIEITFLYALAAAAIAASVIAVSGTAVA
jgi:hypothetical protein